MLFPLAGGYVMAENVVHLVASGADTIVHLRDETGGPPRTVTVPNSTRAQVAGIVNSHIGLPPGPVPGSAS